MRMLALVLVASLVLPLTTRADFDYTFGGANGSFPFAWEWTGDPTGGGVFEIQDEAFTHVSGGHVYYILPPHICGWGPYRFKVRGTDWSFAWRITPDDPEAGKCFCIYYNDYWGWAYNFVEFDWTTLPGYPEGQYMWHNGWHTRIEHHYADPPESWVEVVIQDSESDIFIWVDDELIFELEVTPIPQGIVGLGSDGGGPMWPAFDYVRWSPGSVPVEHGSWARVKSLYK